MFFYLSVHLLLTHKISESRGQNKTKNSFFVFYAETPPDLSKISESRAQNKTYNENNKYNKYKYLIVILKKEIVLIVFIVFLF